MQTTKKQPYKHLSQFERDRIQSLLDQQVNTAEIARIIQRDKATIGREIKRNQRQRGQIPVTNYQRYEATTADHKAYVRRKYAKYQGKKINEHQELRAYIIKGLKQHWNPDEISGAMKQERQSFYASKTAIYEWLDSAWGQRYCRYLDSQRYRPAKRRPKAKRVMIPDRVSIDRRPAGATNRSRYGHFEGDTLVSGKRTKSPAALAVVAERKARYLAVRQLTNLRPDNSTGRSQASKLV